MQLVFFFFFWIAVGFTAIKFENPRRTEGGLVWPWQAIWVRHTSVTCGLDLQQSVQTVATSNPMADVDMATCRLSDRSHSVGVVSCVSRFESGAASNDFMSTVKYSCARACVLGESVWDRERVCLEFSFCKLFCAIDQANLISDIIKTSGCFLICSVRGGKCVSDWWVACVCVCVRVRTCAREQKSMCDFKRRVCACVLWYEGFFEGCIFFMRSLSDLNCLFSSLFLFCSNVTRA